MRSIIARSSSAPLFAACALLISACAAQQAQLQGADRIAKAGKTFSESVPALYDAFFATVVETDSIQLDKQRTLAIQAIDEAKAKNRPTDEAKEAKALGDQLEATNKALIAQLDAVRMAKHHASALRSYFVGLEAFVSNDAGARTGETLKGLVGRVVALNDDVKAKASGLPVKLDTLAESAGKYVVLSATSEKLSAHLKADGQHVRDALSLQAAFIEAINRNTQQDLRNKVSTTIKNPLFADYRKLSGALSNTWWRKRKEYLEYEAEIPDLDNATKAARSLLRSWDQLAAGELSSFSVETLLTDVETALATIEKVRASRETKQ